jgi:hypothetical protein
MMRGAAIVVATLTFLSSTYASAREPIDNDWPPVAPAPDPVAFVVPAGLYYVTDTYVGDVSSTNGLTTTYATTTVHESTGTYARVIDTVGTGARSGFDGSAFNGRGALTDGRALAGTYYENFVLTASGYVPVSIVFFQDDSESRRRESAASPSPSASTAPMTSAPVTSSSTSRSVVAPAPSAPPSSPARPIATAGPRLRAGIALSADGPTLASAEVLRGRLVHFWPRAYANDVAVSIRSWRLLSAQPDLISAHSGGSEPLAAQWIRMPAPGVRLTVRFEIVTDAAPSERLEAEMSITVRSPALID